MKSIEASRSELTRSVALSRALAMTLVLVILVFSGCGGPGGDPPKSVSTGPAIASVTPGSGSVTGGTAITITGTNFNSGATVVVGGMNATAVNVISGGQIQATTPAHSAGVVDVTVRNPKGGGNTTLSGGFTYEGLSITSVSPNSGRTTGGTTVTITGTQFGSGITVLFGGVAASGVSVNGSTQLTAVAPPHSVGSVDVEVSQSGESAILTGGFTYQALTVESLSVTTGPSSGGTSVTVNGTLFDPGATVRFGGVSGSSVSFKSSTQIQATTPPHSSGPVNIDVTNPDSELATLANGFTYAAALTVTGVNPANGPSSGGTSVTLTGTNFLAGASVGFGGISATSVNVLSPSQITAVTPSGSGIVNVTVVNPGGETATLASGFTYDPPKTVSTAPVISSISPSSGGASGGTTVVITGTNFQAGATVSVGGASPSRVEVISAAQISIITAAHSPGPVNIVVTNPDGQSTTATSAFTYLGLTIKSITPSSGSTTGGTTVSILGTQFASGIAVTFGTLNASSVTVISSTQLQAVAPAQGTGVVDVRVTNSNGETATLFGAFTYEPPPTVTSMSREVGSAAGGTVVVFTGTGFLAGIQVFFGGVPSPKVTVVNSNQMQVVTPAHAVGPVDILVQNTDGSQSRLLNRIPSYPAGPAFEYHPAPTVTYVSHDFEDGTLGRFLGDFAPNCIQPFSTTEVAKKGTHSVKTGGSCFLSQLSYRFCDSRSPWLSGSQPCNPALADPKGLYQRFYVMMPQSTIDAVIAGKQLKLLLNRSNIDSPPLDGRWMAAVFGISVGSNPSNAMRFIEDSNLDFVNSFTFVNFQGGVWYEFETHFIRNAAAGTGRARLWVNGVLQHDSGFLPGLGSNNSSLQQAALIGQVTAEPGSFPVFVYVDDVALANGFIEP